MQFLECAFGGVYVPCINSLARGSYRRRFRSSLLCTFSVECYHLPVFVDIDAWFQYEATCSFFAESGQKLPPEFYYRNAYSTKFNSKKKRLLINLANFVKIIMKEL